MDATNTLSEKTVGRMDGGASDRCFDPSRGPRVQCQVKYLSTTPFYQVHKANNQSASFIISVSFDDAEKQLAALTKK